MTVTRPPNPKVHGADAVRRCPTCEGVFTAERLRQVYCSRKCVYGDRAPRPERQKSPNKRCEWCQEPFRVSPSHLATRRFCSRSCQIAERTLELSCPGCGTEFNTARHAPRKTCSEACRRKTQWNSRPQRPLLTKACEWCTDEFRTRSAHQRFCGTSCANNWQGRRKTTHTCKVCEDVFRWSPSRTASGAYNVTYCSQPCRDADPEVHDRLIQMGAMQNKSKTPTAPERILYRLLDQMQIEWEPQHFFEAKFTVDAAIPSLKVVVQADGDYWHGRNLADSEMEPRILRRVKYDRSQDAYMRTCGWTVLRFWESDLIGDLDGCAHMLRRYLSADGHGVVNPCAQASSNATQPTWP